MPQQKVCTEMKRHVKHADGVDVLPLVSLPKFNQPGQHTPLHKFSSTTEGRKQDLLLCRQITSKTADDDVKPIY
jgi:hypothetical protein